MKEQIKVIFLDIDGVLNSGDWEKRRRQLSIDDINTQYPFYEFDPLAIKQLNRIVKETDAKIVVSSTWRFWEEGDQDISDLLERVGVEGEVIDITPTLYARGSHENKDIGTGIPRGLEIDWWLRNKGYFWRVNWSKEEQLKHLNFSWVTNYIILDDDSDMLYGQREHFIKTPHDYGLTNKLADKAIKILNTSIIDLYHENNRTTTKR